MADTEIADGMGEELDYEHDVEGGDQTGEEGGDLGAEEGGDQGGKEEGSQGEKGDQEGNVEEGGEGKEGEHEFLKPASKVGSLKDLRHFCS